MDKLGSIESRFPYTELIDSVVEKDWAAGPPHVSEHAEFLIQRAQGVPLSTPGAFTCTYKLVKYAPAWWKIIDEAIVNALDHLVRCLKTKEPVTRIRVDFGPDGSVAVYNNGEGVPVEVHSVASAKAKKDVYVPTLIFGTMCQGTNRYKDPASIVGGVNGFGAKLCNCYSSPFGVETCDSRRYFLQKWTNRMQIAHPPKIVDLSSKHNLTAGQTTQHTTLNFKPDYVGLFGYKSAPDAAAIADLTDVVRTRVFFAAVYAQQTVRAVPGARVDVWFNGELVPVKTIAEMAALYYPASARVSTVVVPTANEKYPWHTYPWDVCAVIADKETMKIPASRRPCTSMVNGIVVRKGNHHKHIVGQIVTAAKTEVSNMLKDKKIKFSETYVTKNVVLFVSAKIPNPSWEGQRKDEPVVPKEAFAGYILDAKFTKEVVSHLKGAIIAKVVDAEAKEAKVRQKSGYEKYTAARKAGTKQSAKCSLIFLEGDSAKAHAATGISETIDWNYYGTISTGGVPINARKHCMIFDTPLGRRHKGTEVFNNNAFMGALRYYVGLNPNHRYDPASPTYAVEKAQLKYGALIGCVDQDLDGMGHILGLILNMFAHLWPCLLSAGYVKWLRSPLIRVYPKEKGQVQEFYDNASFEEWWKTADRDKYDPPAYYKGIGTHSREEIIKVFKNFDSQLMTFSLDGDSLRMFDVYFGSTPSLRRGELTQPTRVLAKAIVDTQNRTKIISCTDHLAVETNLFQKDNLDRKLDNFIDGQNQVGRKILDGIMKLGNKLYRVEELAGIIAKEENYHHGGASMEKAITGKGFIAPGGKQLPILVPFSNFGTRKGGGEDASSARYIRGRLNSRLTDLLFPKEDYCMLEFTFDEGKRGEPKWFCPILPLAVLESKHNPAHGWKQSSWARDIESVFAAVRNLIADENAPIGPLPPSTYKNTLHPWKGHFGTYKGNLHSFGEYILNPKETQITIVELPLRVWTTQYVTDLRKKCEQDKRIVADIDDPEGDLEVKITITLQPGAIKLLEDMGNVEIDGIQEYFTLYSAMHSRLNLMRSSNQVAIFNSYEDIVRDWFPVRKELYRKRIERRRILLMLKIKSYENIIRYIRESNAYQMSKRTSADQVRLLAAEKYDKMNTARISSPKFTPNEDLEQVVLRGPKANYSYLLAISDSKKSEEALNERMEELEALRKELAALNNEQGRFPGATEWVAELDKLERVIKEGQRTAWLFKDYAKYKLH